MARYSGGGVTTAIITEEVNEAVADLVDSAPATLDTLNELAAALGDDANFATTVASTIGAKYTKPGTGIPASDTATAVQTSLGLADTAYQKPGTGIPSSDMATAVQTSLGLADTASQPAHNHSGIYEPVLGNPDTTGKVLSSTDAGVRSWITPSGGDVSTAQANVIRDNEGITTLRLAKASSLAAAKMLDGMYDGLVNAAGITTATNATLDGGIYGNDVSVKSLLHFNGADAATTFTDETGRVWTAVNNAQLDTAQKKFGTAAYLGDGTGDAIYTPRTDDMILAAQDFTIECWAYLDQANMTGYHCLACVNGGAADWTSDDGYEWALFIYDSDSKLYFGTNNGGAFGSTAVSTLAVDIDGGWHHFAVVNSSGTCTLYLDGTSIGSGALAGGAVTTLTAGTPRLYIGDDLEAGEDSWQGWIDEFRMTVGEAKTNFVPTVEEAEYSLPDMTLVSDPYSAEAQPSSARLLILAGQAGTVNTDIKGYVSRDGGSTYSEVTLVDEGDYDASTRILAGTVDISGQPAGTSMVWKVTTHNAVLTTVSGVRLFW